MDASGGAGAPLVFDTVLRQFLLSIEAGPPEDAERQTAPWQAASLQETIRPFEGLTGERLLGTEPVVAGEGEPEDRVKKESAQDAGAAPWWPAVVAWPPAPTQPEQIHIHLVDAPAAESADGVRIPTTEPGEASLPAGATEPEPAAAPAGVVAGGTTGPEPTTLGVALKEPESTARDEANQDDLVRSSPGDRTPVPAPASIPLETMPAAVLPQPAAEPRAGAASLAKPEFHLPPAGTRQPAVSKQPPAIAFAARMEPEAGEPLAPVRQSSESEPGSSWGHESSSGRQPLTERQLQLPHEPAPAEPADLPAAGFDAKPEIPSSGHAMIHGGRLTEPLEGPPQPAAPSHADTGLLHRTEQIQNSEPALSPPSTEVRRIRLQLDHPAGPGELEVRLTERAGKVHVAVHAPDADVRNTLRGHLEELVGAFERHGMSAETWHPGLESASSSSDRQPASDSERRETWAREFGGSSRQQQQQQQQQQQERPKWLEEMESAARHPQPAANWKNAMEKVRWQV